ncbi:MAG: hypothetical protein JWP11_1173 [Frankiales bacterium]|nr:hypothetical protein [Frankiales bacterium]
MSRSSRLRAVSRRAVALAGVLAAAQLTLVPSTASAIFAVPTFTVSSTADVATNFGACGSSGQTTPTGASLREAICAANNLGTTPSTINVSPGTYTIANGELQMGKVSGSNITLNGGGAASTIINAGGLSRVFDLDPSIVGGVTSSISAVTITGGAVTTFGGAGIIAGSGNAATKDTLTLTNSVVTDNHVNSATTNKYGGGLQLEGGSLTITGSTFSSNSSGSSSGSAVQYSHQDVASGEQLVVSTTTFSGNTTNASVANINVGGALHVDGVSTTPPMSVTNSRFINNTVVGSGTGIAQGAGIFSEGGALTVTGSTFTGNSVGIAGAGAQQLGGAISVVGGTAAVHYNRITGNVANAGSGASLGVASGATLDATNNWWGCNAGPGTSGCDTVAGGPTVSPRLTLTATASPATVVGPNATSTVTGALTQNSLGGAVAGANLVGAFDGLSVGWSDPQPSGATVGAASSTLSSGTASTTYNSQSSSGPGHVLATLDNGTATAAVTVNRAPTITSANSVSFTVGTAGSFTVTTTGYPAPAVTQTGTVPPGMTFTDNGNGTATLAGTPTAGGSFPLSLTANNGVAPNATQTLTVSVTQPPAFTSANTTTFTRGTAGSFTVTTSGVPQVTSITETGALPSGVSFTDNGDGTATLAGTPATGSGGAYPLSLSATNGVSPDGTQTLTLTVNEAPAVTTNPADQDVNPGASVSFSAAASGYPAPTVQWQRSTDGGVSFADIGGATATTYTFTAATGDAGNQYRAVFTNVGGTATTTAATLTVSQAPTIGSANTTTFVVGTAGTFTVTTNGFPNATLTRTAGTLPSGVSFTDNGDGTGTLAGTPASGSGAVYTVTLHAANGVNPADDQVFTLTVNELRTITSADHATFTVGTAGSFAMTTAGGHPTATTLTETGSLPAGVTFTDNGDGTGTLAGTPSAGTDGSYPVTLRATNIPGNVDQAFTLTVNAPPTITSADHRTFVTGAAGTFTVTTSPGTPATTTLTKTGTLPTGVTFVDNGDGTATLAGTPGAGTGGSYPLTIKASNGVASDPTQSFTLTVNQPPAITSADHTTFARAAAGTFTVTTAAGDPAATVLTETGSLPTGVTFTDNGDGTATLGGTPTASGAYPITIKASNGVAPNATQSFTLTVTEPPAITSADHTTFAVGSAGTFTVTTTAGYPATTTVSKTGALPTGVTFTDNGNGTGTLAGTPAAATGGSYPLTLTAANGTTPAQQSFTLTVTQLPALTSADNTSFAVGSAGTFTITTTAGYPAATVLTKTGALPTGVTFTDNGNGTGTLAGTPAAGTGGSYPLTMTATNSAGHVDQAFTLTVLGSPAITSADHTTFAVGSAGTFTVTTTAGYPVAATVTKTGALPAGVTFTDNGNGTATLAGAPAAGAGGTYPLSVTASNGSTTNATQSFTLTVTAVPALTAPAAANAITGTPLSVPLSATGFPVPTLTTASALPVGVTLVDNHNGTGSLTGTPGAGSAGTYPVVVHAANTAGSDDKTVQLHVANPPAPPDSPSPSASPSVTGSPAASPSGSPVRPRLHLTTTTPDITPGMPALLSLSGGAGLPVELRCYSRPALTYSTVRTIPISVDALTFDLRPGGNTRCYARYSGDDSSATDTVVVRVHMVLSLGGVRSGPLAYVFSGRTLPRAAGQVVDLYRLDGLGHDIRTARAVTDATGTWRVSRQFLGGGTFAFVAKSQSTSNAAGFSTPPYRLVLH